MSGWQGYGDGDEVNMLRRHLLGTPAKFGVGANRAAVASHFIKKYGCIDICKSSWHEKKLKVQDSLDSEKIGVVVLDDVTQRSMTLISTKLGSALKVVLSLVMMTGDILVTFIYQKSRSGDITQGLPKVEQVLEVRSIDSISINLEKRVSTWNGRITRILGIPWGFFISAELTIAQSRISLVNQIQKVYRSQGVQIHNRHIEIIVRQITSKVLVSEDGMSNVFLPGELIGLLRAEWAGRSLEESICYRVLLLGITKTSLNTQSFISKASFQETARVLSKAALRGRIDWLKGLKEDVVLGGMMPVEVDSIARAAIRARCHYVNKKWLGGMLTNWYTTKTRLQKFRDLRMQQKTGRFDCFPKKDAAILKRHLAQLETYLGGIKYMKGLPDIVIIVDQQEEYTALRECITLEIPTICLIDTNSDPDLADISIPANDDAIASIRFILNKLVFAICEGRSRSIRNS
ncbi:hypothetical protein VNO80_25193 [Phaseolus coccineus]|uniref:Small ribosomal subunit protein uS2c n=1 Tax=Phaseolus coccineus TaxID=3886 RepID=A0AAN9LZ14_PHACN